MHQDSARPGSQQLPTQQEVRGGNHQGTNQLSEAMGALQTGVVGNSLWYSQVSAITIDVMTQ